MTPPGWAGDEVRRPWWPGTQVLIPRFSRLLEEVNPQTLLHPRVAHILSLRRNKKDQNTQNGTLGRNPRLPASWPLWLVPVLGLVPAGPGKMRQEDGVELVSVLLVVSVTGGTSQTYVLMAGPEDLRS